MSVFIRTSYEDQNKHAWNHLRTATQIQYKYTYYRGIYRLYAYFIYPCLQYYDIIKHSEEKVMNFIKKYQPLYRNNNDTNIDINLRIIVNGQYEKTMSKDDLELTRFMIGGMDAK
jgi:hypothetical protein